MFILIQYLHWHFFELPREILGAWRNFLKFNFNYFSIPLLLKTLFSHWRRYKWQYGRSFDIGKYLNVFFSNLTSRVLGAIMRVFLILLGLLTQIFIIFLGIIVFLGWLALPALLIIGLIFGLIHII